jgi:hypothetical protein
MNTRMTLSWYQLRETYFSGLDFIIGLDFLELFQSNILSSLNMIPTSRRGKCHLKPLKRLVGLTIVWSPPSTLYSVSTPETMGCGKIQKTMERSRTHWALKEHVLRPNSWLRSQTRRRRRRRFILFREPRNNFTNLCWMKLRNLRKFWHNVVYLSLTCSKNLWEFWQVYGFDLPLLTVNENN